MLHFEATLQILTTLAKTARKTVQASTPVAVTLNSLAQGHGPTPYLTPEEAQETFGRLWPNENPQELRYSWTLLADALTRFTDDCNNQIDVASSGYERVYIARIVDSNLGYLVEQVADNAWFGTHGMQKHGWFGPGHQPWDNAMKAIRSLQGYKRTDQLTNDILLYQNYWTLGSMLAAADVAARWPPDVFNAHLWHGARPQEAWDQAIAALLKLQFIVDEYPDCNEQLRVRAALDAMNKWRA